MHAYNNNNEKTIENTNFEPKKQTAGYRDVSPIAILKLINFEPKKIIEPPSKVVRPSLGPFVNPILFRHLTFIIEYNL